MAMRRPTARLSKSLCSLAISLIIAAVVSLGHSPAVAQEPQRDIRWGLSLGLAGLMPIGSDTGQQGVDEDEFEAGLAIRAEILTFDIGSYVQLVPFVQTTVAGGVNPSPYEDVIGTTENLADTPTTHMTQIGFGARYFPVGASWLRPFAAVYLGYVTAEAEYQVQDIDPALIPESLAAMVGPTRETWRHDGLGMTLGLGLRSDLATDALGEEYLFLFALEAQWTKNFWLDLEQYADRTFERALLAPEAMDVDGLALVLSVGFMK